MVRRIPIFVFALVAACGDDPEPAADDGISLSGISVSISDSTGIDPSLPDTMGKLDVQGGETDIAMTNGPDTSSDSGCKTCADRSRRACGT